MLSFRALFHFAESEMQLQDTARSLSTILFAQNFAYQSKYFDKYHKHHFVISITSGIGINVR